MPFRSSSQNNKSVTGANTKAVFAPITGSDPLGRAEIANFTPRIYTMRSLGLGGESADQNSEELPRGRAAQKPQAGIISFQGAMVAEVPIFGWAGIYQGIMNDRSPTRAHAIKGTASGALSATNLNATRQDVTVDVGDGRTGLAKCSRVTLTIAAATSLTSVTVRLTGTTHTGRTKTKSYKIELTSGAGTLNTKDYWKTITSHQLIARAPATQAIAGTLAIGAITAPTGTLAATTLANVHESPPVLNPVELTFTPTDTSDPLPHHAYIEEGGIPKAARGLYFQGLSFNAVKNTLPAVNLDLLGLRVAEYENVAVLQPISLRAKRHSRSQVTTLLAFLTRR